MLSLLSFLSWARPFLVCCHHVCEFVYKLQNVADCRGRASRVTFTQRADGSELCCTHTIFCDKTSLLHVKHDWQVYNLKYQTNSVPHLNMDWQKHWESMWTIKQNSWSSIQHVEGGFSWWFFGCSWVSNSFWRGSAGGRRDLLLP